METVKVDDKKRVRLPDAKPGQVLAYEMSGEVFTLTPIKKDEPQAIRGRLVRRKGRLMLSVPDGWTIAPGPIPREVPE